MNFTSLHFALPEAAADGAPPEWLHLVPAGTFRGMDGRGPYTLASAQDVIDASMAPGKIPLDENHSTEFAKTTGQPSPARGWIDSMQARADGIWGHVEWNSTGAALWKERAYRGISPVIGHDAAGVIGRVKSAALTNSANFAQLQTLHHQQDGQMNLTALRAALGLPETADEAAILARVTANATAASMHSQAVTDIATAAGVQASDAAGLVTALQAQRALAGDNAKMLTEIVSLQGQLTTLKNDTLKTKATAFIDGAIQAGKPIAPVRDQLISRHMAAPAEVETLVNAMPSLHALGISAADLAAAHAEQGDGMAELTEDDRKAADKMGIPHDKFAAHKARMRKGK